MFNKNYLIGALSLSLCMVSTNAIGYEFNEAFKKPYLELGYARLKHAKKLSLLQDYDTVEETTAYSKEKLSGSNAFYLNLGFKTNEYLRVGLEYFYTSNNKLSASNALLESGVITSNMQYHSLKTKHQVYLLNFSVSPYKMNNFEPFLGLSLGVSNNKISSVSVDNSSTNSLNPDVIFDSKSSRAFAWGANLGARYFFHSNMYLTGSYKFLDFGKLKGSHYYTNMSDNSRGDEGAPKVKGHLRSHLFMVGVGYQF